MKLISFFFCLILAANGFSQGAINGVIKDAKTKEGIPFAAVGIKGTSKGTLTDEKGKFELEAAQVGDKDTLRISSIGYASINIVGSEFKKEAAKGIHLEPMAYDLAEIVVKPNMRKILGTSKYSKDICTAFSGQTGNWRGEQAAILVPNKEKKTYYLESFGFYVIKNEYPDSLQFRVMFYEVNPWGYPGETFLKKPILFKTKVKSGEVRVDLKDLHLSTSEDFFISLECLEEKMEASKFCFAGSVKVPSYFKPSAFAKWGRVRGGGGDLNVEVSYQK